MERPEILEILIQSLHHPALTEQRVAYAFLRDVLVRPGEPFTHRARAALHLISYRLRCAASAPRELARRALHAVPRIPRSPSVALPSVWSRWPGYVLTARYLLLFGYIAAANGFLWLREAPPRLRAVVSARTSLLGIAVTDRCAGAVSVVLSIASRAGTALVTARARSAAALTAIVARVTAALMTSRASVLAAVATAGFGAAAVFVWTRGLLRATYRGVGRSISEFRAAIERTVRSYAARVSHTIARARASVIDRYVKTRDSLVLLVTRIVDRVDRAYRAAAAFYGEVKRQATRQVLPDAATPVIAAALVCMVLFVFGINSYFIINDVERKGVFFDSSRHDWGDEALASMLIGEGYDIYLQKKITDKRIKELLATGKYYERVIRVTGYYSPLPDQNKYATGSYRGDIILNGRGIMGSDTTPVYMGMAAGPPHLEYGTNIIIEDLGKFNLPKIYTVHDRGGAINGNRLDIWVGKGEEAMKKAYEITGYYKVIVVGDK